MGYRIYYICCNLRFALPTVSCYFHSPTTHIVITPKWDLFKKRMGQMPFKHVVLSELEVSL